jgi:hypothetical protein
MTEKRAAAVTKSEAERTWGFAELHGCWWAYEGKIPPPEAFKSHGRPPRRPILGLFSSRHMAEARLGEHLSRRKLAVAVDPRPRKWRATAHLKRLLSRRHKAFGVAPIPAGYGPCHANATHTCLCRHHQSARPRLGNISNVSTNALVLAPRQRHPSRKRYGTPIPAPRLWSDQAVHAREWLRRVVADAIANDRRTGCDRRAIDGHSRYLTRPVSHPARLLR